MKTNRIIFMGSSNFSLASLKRLSESGFNIIGVYSREPKPTGRKYKIQKTVVHEYAEQRNIPVFTPKTLKNENVFISFQKLRPDVVVVSSYGLIIPKNFLDETLFINIHASLLPRWRGASPIQSAILNGDSETGITIMKMDDGLDTGDIISMKSIAISQEDTFGKVSSALAGLGADMIEYTLLNLPSELLKARKQPNIGACYAQKISKESCFIDWKESCINTIRRIKAFSPIPATWTEINGLRIKIFDAKTVKNDIENNKNKFLMKCSDGFLELTEVQPAGRNKMTGEEFMRGYKIK